VLLQRLVRSWVLLQRLVLMALLLRVLLLQLLVLHLRWQLWLLSQVRQGQRPSV
jgi:hypothetical protein